MVKEKKTKMPSHLCTNTQAQTGRGTIEINAQNEAQFQMKCISFIYSINQSINQSINHPPTNKSLTYMYSSKYPELSPVTSQV